MPDNCNTKKFEIGFCVEINNKGDLTGRFIKMCNDESIYQNVNNFDDWILKKAQKQWKQKYKESIGIKNLEYIPAEVFGAGNIPYDGPTELSTAEQEAMRIISNNGTDLTMDMVYLMVERLGWRPGMLKQGVIPTQEQVHELYQWPERNEDPDGWLEIAFYLLFTEVEGTEKKDIILPLYYQLGENCPRCGEPLGFLIDTLEESPDIYSLRCGNSPHCFFGGYSVYSIGYEVDNSAIIERFPAAKKCLLTRRLQGDLRIRSNDKSKLLVAVPHEELENEYYFICPGTDKSEFSMWNNGLDKRLYIHEAFTLFNDEAEIIKRLIEWQIDEDMFFVFKMDIDEKEKWIKLSEVNQIIKESN